tara:strand:+ start:2422 stop:3954 length:1533 start_codon:yes stop_codon:yes gene_type:complete
MDLIDRFASAFEGSSVAHGQTQVGSTRRNGKTEAKSFIVREPLTKQLIEDHLKGKHGVGSIPINDKNMCKFGALDIDTYPIDHVSILKKCRRFKIPLVVCRSKSGGAHLFLFTEDWITATDMRDHLQEFAAVLGFGGCEVFPKQDKILSERGDVGNFINLPYFDQDNTLRYAINEKGQELSFEQFLDYVDKHKTNLQKMRKLQFVEDDKELKEMPPCLKIMFATSVPDGTRNKVMFHAGITAKMMYPDDWESALERWNQKYCKPSLPANEIVTIQQQHKKKEYGYLCKEDPMSSHCDKTACKQVKFGVGNSESMPTIGGLTVLKSEPRLYFMDVDGKRLELTTEQLQMPLQFQRACMEQIDNMPPLVKSSDWQVLVNTMLQSAVVIEVPKELTFKGQFEELLEIYCTSRIRAKSPEEMVLGKPWTENDLTFFTLKGLMEFLRNRGFNEYKRPQIQQRLKDLNGGHDCNSIYKLKDEDTGQWKNLRVWHVPEFDNTELTLPTEEKFNDIPF